MCQEEFSYIVDRKPLTKRHFCHSCLALRKKLRKAEYKMLCIPKKAIIKPRMLWDESNEPGY